MDESQTYSFILSLPFKTLQADSLDKVLLLLWMVLGLSIVCGKLLHCED